MGETTRAMQYFTGYWGPLPLPSLKGLVGEWCWLLGNAGCCALCGGTLSVCGDPGLDQASFFPQLLPGPLLVKPKRSRRARELVVNTAQSSGTRTVWSNMEKGTWKTASNRVTTECLNESWQQQTKTPGPTTAL